MEGAKLTSQEKSVVEVRLALKVSVGQKVSTCGFQERKIHSMKAKILQELLAENVYF